MEKKFEVTKPVIYRLAKRNVSPSLTGRYYPGYLRLPTEEVIYDPQTKSNRIIRYAPGEASIYKDEQSDTANVSDVLFVNGSLRVDYTNPLLIEYLTKSNHNTENPNRLKEKEAIFYEYNPEKVAEKELDEELAKAEAVSLIATLDFDVLKGYARVLGINIDRSSKEIKHDLMVLAKRNPKEFTAGIDDPTMKRMQTVYSAIDNGVILIKGRQFMWASGATKGTPIMVVPSTQDMMKFFTDWTMFDKDGEKVYAEIMKKLPK